MASTLRDIADALADSLAAYTFAIQPAVQRVNWPDYSVEDMADPVMAVQPSTFTIERVDRNNHQYDYAVIAFLGRHTPTNAAADGMLDLAEEVADAIRQHDWDQSVQWPTGVTSPVEVSIDINPDEALQERNVWRAVITATYRVFRS